MDSNYYDINTAGGMTGGIDREGSRVKGKDIAYKKACTIPDIVALDILTKYKIDIHDANFMHDSRAVRKVIAIMKSEYPALMSY